MINFHLWIWTAVGLAVVVVAARGFWLYRASLTWPSADGKITRLEIERKRAAGTPSGPYFCATFTYDFIDGKGNRRSGTWFKNFSSEQDARAFAARELPVGKKVVVRYSPKKPRGPQRFGAGFVDLHRRPAAQPAALT